MPADGPDYPRVEPETDQAGKKFSAREKATRETREEEYSGGAAARPDADGGTACLANIVRTGAPHGAAPPHSVTIQA